MKILNKLITILTKGKIMEKSYISIIIVLSLGTIIYGVISAFTNVTAEIGLGYAVFVGYVLLALIYGKAKVTLGYPYKRPLAEV